MDSERDKNFLPTMRTLGVAARDNFRILSSDLDHYEAEFTQANVSIRARVSKLLSERQGASRSVILCDIGCGTGKMLTTLRKEFPTENLKLVGISAGDPRDEKKKIADAALGITFDDSASFQTVARLSPIDVFVSKSAFGHFEDPLSVLKEAYAMLATGGEMYISWAFEHFAEKFRSWAEAEEALEYIKKLGYDITLDFHDVMVVRKTHPTLELPNIHTNAYEKENSAKKCKYRLEV